MKNNPYYNGINLPSLWVDIITDRDEGSVCVPIFVFRRGSRFVVRYIKFIYLESDEVLLSFVISKCQNQNEIRWWEY